MYTNHLFNFWVATTLFLAAGCAPRTEPTLASDPGAAPGASPTFISTEEPTLVPTVTPQPAPTVPAIDPESNFPTGKFLWPDGKTYFLFTQDGRWTHTDGKDPLNMGRFKVEGDTYIQISNLHCPGPMSFKFTFDGANLTFNLTEQSRNDPCGDRKSFYDNVTYTLIP